MAITKLNSLAIPPNTVVESDISFPLDSASFTGDFTVDTDTLVVDATNNHVKIGDTAATPDGFLSIRSDSDAHAISIYEPAGANENWQIGVNASGDLQFYDSGSTAGSVTFQDGGNVGIGTGSSVDTKLHVENSSGIASVKIESGGAGTQSNLYFQDANTTVDGSIRIGSAGNDFRFFTSSTERMRIDSSGTVGINGTKTFSEKLIVHENTASSYSTSAMQSSSTAFLVNSANNLSSAATLTLRQFNGTSAISGLYTGTNDGALTFGTSSAASSGNVVERMRIDSSGNVGIGTTSPAQKLHVNGFALFENAGEIRFKDTGGTQRTSIAMVSNDLKVGTSAGGNLIFVNGSSYTERMRIDSSGNLLVGTTTTVGTGTEGVQIATNGSIITGRNQTSTQTHMVFKNPNGSVGSITTLVNATSFNTSSDQRLKENITDAPAGNIDAIRVRSFDWKADGSHQTYGMVAQELVEVAPEAVSQGETEDDMWGVDYSKLVPMMIKEIQDLKAEVAALKGA